MYLIYSFISRRRHHVSSERWLTWKNSHVWLMCVLQLLALCMFHFFFRLFHSACGVVFQCNFLFQLFFCDIVHKTMPCRHASKPWHGDGSVTSTYSSSLYAHICAFSIYIYILLFYFCEHVYILLMLFVASLGFVIFYSFNVFKYNILLWHAIRL